MNTLGTNEERLNAAVELLQFKAARALAKGKNTLTIEDINEAFIVAGMPALTPKKELEVIEC